jgi:hypothetical protein
MYYKILQDLQLATIFSVLIKKGWYVWRLLSGQTVKLALREDIVVGAAAALLSLALCICALYNKKYLDAVFYFIQVLLWVHIVRFDIKKL